MSEVIKQSLPILGSCFFVCGEHPVPLAYTMRRLKHPVKVKFKKNDERSCWLTLVQLYLKKWKLGAPVVELVDTHV